jgi:hypothetical protein
MGAVKKFKDDYPKEKPQSQPSNPLEDKRLIEAYIKKIDELLKDPTKQQKAAQILNYMINKK